MDTYEFIHAILRRNAQKRTSWLHRRPNKHKYTHRKEIYWLDFFLRNKRYEEYLNLFLGVIRLQTEMSAYERFRPIMKFSFHIHICIYITTDDSRHTAWRWQLRCSPRCWIIQRSWRTKNTQISNVMEPEVSLSPPQQHFTVPYPEPVQSSSHLRNLPTSYQLLTWSKNNF
jgi:hypothetical protein